MVQQRIRVGDMVHYTASDLRILAAVVTGIPKPEHGTVNLTVFLGPTGTAHHTEVRPSAAAAGTPEATGRWTWRQ